METELEDMKRTHVLVQLLVGGGGIFLLKSYNTREHSVCGLAKLIWRASEDTKYMARKKGGTQLYGIVTALEKARRHRYDGGNRHQVLWG